METIWFSFTGAHKKKEVFRPEMGKREGGIKSDQASSFVWLALGAGVVYLSYRLGLGTLTHPGPGFMCFWSGLILCALSVVVFLKGRLAAEANRIGQLWSGLKWSKAVLILLALVIYGLTFSRIGFLLSTTALLIFLFRAIDPVRWWAAILGAVLASLISFIVFNLWLQVQLPSSFLEMFLFKMKGILFRG